MKNRFTALAAFIVMLFSWQWINASEKSVQIDIPQGHLTVIPLSQRAVRFQLTDKESVLMPEYIYLESNKRVKFSLKKKDNIISVVLKDMSVDIDQSTGGIIAKDREGKVIFTQTRMSLTKGSVQNRETYKAEMTFLSPKDEHLNGLGQFQDGYLNVRGLTRRLTQVNTQISVPMIVSDRGYGLLWNNYGMTDFNPCSKSVALVRNSATAKTDVVDQTTSEGNQKAEIRSNMFQATMEIDEEGDYALLLDMGQKMAHSHNLLIDGDTVINMQNIWLPPTTSTICHLAKGVHQLSSITDKNDSPTLYYRKVEDNTTFSSPVAQAVDFTLFAGSPQQIIASYREETGNAPLMPVWALGYIHCRERFHSQDEILKTAQRFRDEKYPIDMIVQDWQYWGKNGWNAMKFDSASYPDPKALVDGLHNKDIRFMLSVWSKIDENSQVGKEMAKKGYFIPNTTWVDFFNPKAAEEYWKNFSNKLLKPYQIDAWWQDATEPENDDLQGRLIADKTMPGEVYRNIYPIFVNRTVYDGAIKDMPNKRTMILTRCGYSGIQKYGTALWSGDVGNDFETLRRQITGGLGLVATGLPWWTVDAGGFFRPRNQYTDAAYHERYARWLEVATFLPMMRVHGYMSDTEFWNYGEQVERVAHKYLELRYRMLPYIYTQAKEVSDKGSSILRPLMMDFSHDKKAMEEKYEFMFGPSILVAPVVKEGVSRWNVYLPDNKKGWVDFWDGQEYNPATNIVRDADIDIIPVFVEKGSIITLADNLQSTAQLNQAPLEIRVYPGADAKTYIYRDNGSDMTYLNGESSIVRLSWNDKKGELEIGKREGNFEGESQSIPMKIIVVKGKESSSYKQHSIDYKGKRMVVKLIR